MWVTHIMMTHARARSEGTGISQNYLCVAQSSMQVFAVTPCIIKWTFVFPSFVSNQFAAKYDDCYYGNSTYFNQHCHNGHATWGSRRNEIGTHIKRKTIQNLTHSIANRQIHITETKTDIGGRTDIGRKGTGSGYGVHHQWKDGFEIRWECLIAFQMTLIQNSCCMSYILTKSTVQFNSIQFRED